LAVPDCVLQIANSLFNMNGYTISGNSTINRLLIQTYTIGISLTITIGGGTFVNCDFRDITANTPTDISAITGLSGDCGGNSNFTFTTAVDQHWIAASGGNWSDVTKWTSRVPLPQDDAYFDNAFSASQTVTANMPRLGKSIDWTGATGSPTFGLNSTPNTRYGSMTLISAMTLTTGQTQTLEGRGSFTLTSAGKSFGVITMSMFGGTLTLQDALTCTGAFTLNNGTFNTNDFNVTLANIAFSGSNLRSILMGFSTWSLSAIGVPWSGAVTTNLTFNSGTSTILLSDISASSKTFQGGNLIYNNLAITGGGTGAVIITGANTFNRITVIGGTKSITLPGSATTTLLSGQGLGNGTNVITFTASAGSATISKASGTLSWDYVSLTNIPSTGGATFYAGANSTDGGGNTGWIFSDAPITSNNPYKFSHRFNTPLKTSQGTNLNINIANLFGTVSLNVSGYTKLGKVPNKEIDQIMLSKETDSFMRQWHGYVGTAIGGTVSLSVPVISGQDQKFITSLSFFTNLTGGSVELLNGTAFIYQIQTPKT